MLTNLQVDQALVGRAGLAKKDKFALRQADLLVQLGGQRAKASEAGVLTWLRALTGLPR